MKKLFTLFYISLIIGLAFVLAGGIMINRAEVNMGQIYDVIEKSLQFGEQLYTFEKTEAPDISSFNGCNMDRQVTYPLNEFHTLELLAENCCVEFISTESDDMKITLDYPDKLQNTVFLCTAMQNGSLYASANRTDNSTSNKDVSLTIEIPDNYKGGYVINTDKCSIILTDLESAMDMNFKMQDTVVEADMLTAGDITFELAGTVFNSKGVFSRGSTNISSESTTVNFKRLNSSYTKILSSSSTYNIEKISGGISSDSQTSVLNLGFQTVKSNVSVTADTGSINISIPHNAPVSLRHEEKYSSFKDNVKWTDEGSKNKESRFIIDTKVKFSIVTLNEIE